MTLTRSLPSAARALAASLLLAMLSAFLALPIEGCAAIAAALPDVITAIIDGGQILDAIAAFVASYFAMHPDPAAQAKVADAIAKARISLNVALHAAQAANGVENADVDTAFADFEAAYLALLELVKPYGVKPAPMPTTRLTAEPGQLTVPEPMAFRLTAKKGK